MSSTEPIQVKVTGDATNDAAGAVVVALIILIYVFWGIDNSLERIATALESHTPTTVVMPITD